MGSSDRFFIISGSKSMQKPRQLPISRPKPQVPIGTRDDTSDASTRSTTPRSSSSHASPSDTRLFKPHSPLSSSPESTVTPGPSLFYRFEQQLEDLAIARQYSGLQYSPARLERSGEALFAKLYRSSAPSDPVRHAIEAHALVKFAEVYPSPAVHQAGNQHYSKALQMVQMRLNDPRAARTTDLAVAVWMMANYEYLSGDPRNFQKFQSHVQGMLAMLTLRDPTELDSDGDFSEFFYTISAQILPSFIRRAEPLPRFRNGAPWLNPFVKLKGGDNPLDVFIRIGCGIVDLRARSKKAFEDLSSQPGVDEAMGYIHEALALDRLLDNWYSTLPAQWRLFEIERRSDDLAINTVHQLYRRSWPQYRHIYPHGLTAEYLAHYFFLRMHACLIVCKCSNSEATGLSLADHNANSQLRLRDMADDFCASACTFFTYPGYPLNDTLITLAHVKLMEIIPLHQRNWIDDCFDIAYEKFGKSQAPSFKTLRPCILTGRSEFSIPR